MTKKPSKLETHWGDETVTVEYHYSPGRPGRMYMDNGDPGYPEDPPEIEILSVMGPHGEIEEPGLDDTMWERIAEHEADFDYERKVEAAEFRAEQRRDDAAEAAS